MKKTTLFAILFAALLGITGHAHAQYDLSWRTVDGGGGTSTGGAYSLSGTIAQPDAGNLSGGTYALAGGFWPGAGGVNQPTCPADISPQPSGNGIIDIDDLFGVINGWGVCPPSCPADINHSTVVDVDDLFIVINAWGVCP